MGNDVMIRGMYNTVDQLRDKCHELATEIEYFLCDYIIAQKALESENLDLGNDVFEDYQGWAEALEDILNMMEKEGLA